MAINLKRRIISHVIPSPDLLLRKGDESQLGAYTAWRERVMQRPTVKKVVEDEQNVS